MRNVFIAMIALLTLTACAGGEGTAMSEKGLEREGLKPAYRRFTARAHREYQRDLDLLTVAEVGMPRPAAAAPRGRRTRTTAGKGSRARTADAFRLNPTTPYTGSPEWKREQDYAERRERELGRSIRRICASC